MTPWEAGDRIGPYELITPVGAGGMGDVWKARDTRLGRLVALKRLRVRTEAFAREARAIAALNHPNICTLHDVGDHYLVMELLDGRPLAGPLEPDDATRIAIQIADALDAAHRRGIVHRDLKPANVMLVDGRPKLLDFGIATLRDPAVIGATMTAEQAVSGTPAYMAPEQAQGLPVDARADIFSFGALLYELLSGRAAFDGSSPLAIVAAVLRDDPAPLATTPPLAEVVRRCLEKSPGRRFQTAAELRLALESASGAARQTASIAVLPFTNLSPDPEHEYFSDGLTEEIISALARVEGLKVIARTSAFAFKGQRVQIRQVAETLGVTTVLEGSVRRAGNRIRVTAQLIQASDGCHLWSERYDRELADVFAVQDEIASAIVLALRARIGGAATTAPALREYTPAVAAYEAFLMARHHVWRHTTESFAQAQRSYEQAIALDPQYGLPYVGIAELLHIRASLRGPAAQEAARGVRPALERALSLDPSLAEAHAWMGIVDSTYDYDWASATRRFEAALTEPVPPRVRHLHAYFRLRLIGRAAEAVAEHLAALQHDPLNLITRVGLVMSLMSAERHDEASAEANRLLELAPEFAANYGLLTVNVAREPLDVALSYAERGYALVPFTAGTAGLLAGLLRRKGDDRRADALLREVEDPGVYGNPVDLALYHLACGEVERAFEYLDRLVDQHHPMLIMVLVGGPYGPLLRVSPRWPAFARRIGLGGP